MNCSFYFKIGACRHGDRCSRIHNKPTFSQTIVLQNLYINPQNSAKTADGSHMAGQAVSDEEMQEHYDNFFEEVFVECEDKYGEIEEMNVCDNLGDHLVVNVYIKFKYETEAEMVGLDFLKCPTFISIITLFPGCNRLETPAVGLVGDPSLQS